MQAIGQDRYGTAEVLQVMDIEVPPIGEHDVLIRVRAAGVNPADWAVMSGLPYIARPVYGLRRPKQRVRGTDVAGTVEAVGAAVTRFQSGDRVFGWTEGSFADYASAPEGSLVLKPLNLSFEQAASVPLAGMVALQALRDHGHVGNGTTVLINGASGGIGTFAVQIARAFGAEVTAVASAGTADLLRSIGADHVVDYTREDFTQSAQKYDVLLDNVGNHSLADLRRAITPTGTVIPNAGSFDNHWFASGGRVMSARVLSQFIGQNLRPFLVAPNLADLIVLRSLIEAGKVTPVIDRTYPLRQAARAIDHVGTGHAHGKVAITV